MTSGSTCRSTSPAKPADGSCPSATPTAYIDPWQGGLIFLGYVLLFLVPAMIVLKKRDV